MDSKTVRIRALNDELRQNFAQGMAVMTPGIAALGAEAVADRQDHRCVRRLLSRQRSARRTRLWRVRSRGKQDLFQDRLLRREPHVPLPRSGRSLGHQARDHHHAGRGVLTIAPALTIPPFGAVSLGPRPSGCRDQMTSRQCADRRSRFRGTPI
jgi:hypothetical protein